jgi:hypothetical protein
MVITHTAVGYTAVTHTMRQFGGVELFGGTRGTRRPNALPTHHVYLTLCRAQVGECRQTGPGPAGLGEEIMKSHGMLHACRGTQVPAAAVW